MSDKLLKKDLENLELSHVIDITDAGALIIYVPNTTQFPPQKWRKYVEAVRETFEAIFPDITIVATEHKLEFTAISKKQTFKGKLDGQIQS